MREHPIPQDITGYRFHIIGSMTLKQFAEIALGVVVAVVFYSTNLPAIIKWPLIGVSIGLGAAAAFLPIQERPLDHWIITFWKVLYKPTLFYWKRTPAIPSAFSFVANATTVAVEPEFDLSPIRRQRIKEYIGSVTHSHAEPYDLSNDEQSRVASIMASFTTQPVLAAPTTAVTTTEVEKPDLEVRVRKLRPQQSVETEVYISTPATPAILIQDSTPETIESVSTAVATPISPIVHVESINTTQTIFSTQEVVTTKDQSFDNDVSQISPTQASESINPNQAVAYNTDLPFPSTPTETNKVVGMVLTTENDLISDAIVEIKTNDGVVARAVKSNALGQFFITTPLADGEYTIVVEKDGFVFSPLQLVLSNQIVQPIEIRNT